MASQQIPAVVASANILSGQIGSPHLASGGIGSANIASGIIGQAALSSGAVQSGQIASGVPTTFARTVFNDSLTTEEAISGVRAVTVSQSGTLRIAMASVSGRMPAMGLALDNALSGAALIVRSQGFAQFASGLADFSGFVAQSLFVGRSGSIIQLSGSFGSGGLLSGDFTQFVGVAVNTGGMYMSVNPNMTSGRPIVLFA